MLWKDWLLPAGILVINTEPFHRNMTALGNEQGVMDEESFTNKAKEFI